MHLAQVVSFVSLCATRTWKNWKTPSTLKLSLTECAGVDYDYKALAMKMVCRATHTLDTSDVFA